MVPPAGSFASSGRSVQATARKTAGFGDSRGAAVAPRAVPWPESPTRDEPTRAPMDALQRRERLVLESSSRDAKKKTAEKSAVWDSEMTRELMRLAGRSAVLKDDRASERDIRVHIAWSNRQQLHDFL